MTRLILVLFAATALAACTGDRNSSTANTAALPPPGTKAKPGVAIVAPKAPPPSIPEVVPPKPKGPDDGHFVWNPGHYHWDSSQPASGNFTWLPGGFVERPYAGSVWTNGGWAFSNGQWGWTPGYWQ